MGHGRFKLKGRVLYAHRVAYAIELGDPGDVTIDRTCRNPRCVRPDHLKPGRGERAPAKPRKPRPDFALFPHANGYWAQEVRGELCYFGKVADGRFPGDGELEGLGGPHLGPREPEGSSPGKVGLGAGGAIPETR